MAEFKPKDWILVRDTIHEAWHLAQFSHFNNENRVCICGSGTWYLKGIPYEGNEELLGTTKIKEPDFKFKFLDKVYVKFNKEWVEGYYIYSTLDFDKSESELYGIAVKYEDIDDGRVIVVSKDKIAKPISE